jgi:glutaminyl-peptide cyclotransferase
VLRLGFLGLLGLLATLPGLAVEQLRVQVHRTLPHDRQAFTQGLVWHAGKLYESTGLRGRSALRRIDPGTGAVEQRRAISVMHFGEGLAWQGERLVMLTWHAEQALVFGIEDFDRRPAMGYRGEGWGLCHDGVRFVMSDGSARLTFRDSETFAALGSVAVTQDGRPLADLNELECVGDSVYANVFRQDFIVRIDPATGAVTERIDAGGLLTAEQAAGADVLNGIAHDPETGRFYITGKLWPVMFEVSFVP